MNLCGSFLTERLSGAGQCGFRLERGSKNLVDGGGVMVTVTCLCFCWRGGLACF